MQVAFIVYVSAVAVQLLFFLILLFAMRRKQRPSGQSSKPSVSIVICAHDEENNLKDLIPMLLGQNYPTFEIVIVNDRSNDNTFDWLIAETRKDHRLRMVHVNRLPEHVTSKKYALTLGIKSALYDVILLTDADCRPTSQEWISEMAGNFGENTRFVLGFSPYQKTPGFLNLFVRFETLLTAVQYLGFGFLRMPYMGVGRNLAYRKSFFLEKKGFVNMLSIVGGDDDLFVNRHATAQNTAIAISPAAKMVSVPKDSWKTFLVQKIRHLSVGKHYTFRFKIILGLFMLSWIITWWAGLTLLALNTMTVVVASLLGARCLMLTIVFYTSIRRLDEKFEVGTLPVLDFLFSFYYISTGLVALITKKIRWKN